jgi:hypothetical protein
MKTIYLIYAILYKQVSVLRVDEDMRGKKIVWAAHDKPQDGYGGHNGKWAEGSTPQEAVWNLRSA